MKLLFLMLLILYMHSCNAKEQIDLTISDNEKMATLYPEFDMIFSENFSYTGNETLVKFRSKTDANAFSIYKISILLSKTGERRIYIFSPESCKSSSSYTTSYIKTDKRNISYTVFCSNSQQVMTPRSNHGARYLIDLLNNEEFVTLHFPERQVTFDAFGFSSAWLNFGGNAL
ncbi:hypothetical protein CGK40_23010 [Vibrio parahaemolyticus]|uniref:hypothetical protein n=1 Tax=Vibrio parahaemolyticus TaxID=670 RepID=UPI001123DFEA|nr:hypothetical protein [Vibrio parahaemolyticus]TNZ87819.1 hypothetical protein CGK40_23010 [Vibrio parahaemolyticus]